MEIVNITADENDNEKEIDSLLKRNSQYRTKKLKEGGGYRVKHNDTR